MQLSGRSLPIESVRSDLPGLCADMTTESVTPLFDRLTHDAPLEFSHSPCLNQPLPQLDHNPHSGGSRVFKEALVRGPLFVRTAVIFFKDELSRLRTAKVAQVTEV